MFLLLLLLLMMYPFWHILVSRLCFLHKIKQETFYPTPCSETLYQDRNYPFVLMMMLQNWSIKLCMHFERQVLTVLFQSCFPLLFVSFNLLRHYNFIILVSQFFYFCFSRKLSISCQISFLLFSIKTYTPYVLVQKKKSNRIYGHGGKMFILF